MQRKVSLSLLATGCLLLLSLIGLSAMAQDEGDTDVAMIEAQNAELVRHFVEQHFIERNADVLEETYLENAVWCAGAALSECTPLSNAVRRQWTEQLFEAFPDLDISIEQVVADGNTVFIEMVASGTFSQSILESMTGTTIAPTNRVETWSWLMIDTVEDGLVIEERWYWLFYGWPVTPPR